MPKERIQVTFIIIVRNPDEFDHQDVLFEEKVYGNKC